MHKIPFLILSFLYETTIFYQCCIRLGTLYIVFMDKKTLNIQINNEKIKKTHKMSV